jgi:hypothetical protein
MERAVVMQRTAHSTEHASSWRKDAPIRFLALLLARCGSKRSPSILRRHCNKNVIGMVRRIIRAALGIAGNWKTPAESGGRQ